jgi:hypothetical protein
VNVKLTFPDAEDVEAKFTVAVNESRGFPVPMIETTNPLDDTVGGVL